MHILIVGASGFIGSALADALRQHGHTLRGAARHRPASLGAMHGWITMDHETAHTADAWRDAVTDIDAVVNSVGILREERHRTFEGTQHLGPAALFTAARNAGVKRIVQLSALGAAPDGITPYFRSKAAADDMLRTLGVPYTVVKPSLVFHPSGASSQLFLRLAHLPVLPDWRGTGPIQPIHRTDLVDALVRLLEMGDPPAELPAPGPRAMSTTDYLRTLHTGLGLGSAWSMPVPAIANRLAAEAAQWVPGSPLTPDNWAMMEQGNAGDPGPISALLDRPLIDPADFLKAA